MTEDRTAELRQTASIRRTVDTRLSLLERAVEEVLTTVRGIDSSLRFPENSPLGRELTGRADRNANRASSASPSSFFHKMQKEVRGKLQE